MNYYSLLKIYYKKIIFFKFIILILDKNKLFTDYIQGIITFIIYITFNKVYTSI
jgi:hypothetical protein